MSLPAHCRFVLVAGVTICAMTPAYSQDVSPTDLVNWTPLTGSSGPAGKAGTISASAPIKGLPGARITATMSCGRTGKHDDLTVGPIWPSIIFLDFAMSGNLLDTNDTMIDDLSHCVKHGGYYDGIGNYHSGCAEYAKIPEHDLHLQTGWRDAPSLGSDQVITDLHRFSTWVELTPKPADGKLSSFDDYYVDFSSAEVPVKLHISPRTPALAKFLSQCGTPNREQAEIIAHEKPILARKAAEAAAAAKAEAARREQARIDQEKTAEQARLLAEKQAAELAPIKAEQEKNYAEALARLTDYLGLGPIPDSCIKRYEGPDKKDMLVTIDLYTVRPSILYTGAVPAATPSNQDTPSRKRRDRNPGYVTETIGPGQQLTTYLNELKVPGPFYDMIQKYPSDKRYIGVKQGDFGGLSYISVDSLGYCGQERIH